MKIIPFFILFTFLFSCNKKNEIERVEKGKLSINDTVYTKKKINFINSDFDHEELEIYVSNQNDTIANQAKRYINNKIDSTKSNFYELQITKTKKPDVYKARIKFHSSFDFKKLSKKRRAKIWLIYSEKTKDSSFFTTIKVENSKIIEFEYTNIESNKLSGLMRQYVQIDTIVKKEKMVRMLEYQLLIDNFTKTNNSCVKGFDLYETNRFHLRKEYEKVE